MAKLSIDQVSFENRRILMRVDFNVPLKDGQITDDTRIRAALPSIQHIVAAKGKLVLMSHMGRPKGERKMEFSLAPVAQRLGELLDQKVVLAPDCIGDETNGIVNAMTGGDVVLLENVRFHTAETDNDATFSQALAAHGDVYVNDAFGAAHRAHASTHGVTQYIDECAAGFLMNAE